MSDCLQGAGSLLPALPGPLHSPAPQQSQVGLQCPAHTVQPAPAPALSLQGGNTRLAVATLARTLLRHQLTTAPDDTKALTALVAVYQVLLLFTGVAKSEYDNRWKSFQAIKKAMENKLLRSKKLIRAILVDRTHLQVWTGLSTGLYCYCVQHESRVLEGGERLFTSTHFSLYQVIPTYVTAPTQFLLFRIS